MLLLIVMMNDIFNLQVIYSNVTTILLRAMPTWVYMSKRGFCTTRVLLETLLFSCSVLIQVL